MRASLVFIFSFTLSILSTLSFAKDYTAQDYVKELSKSSVILKIPAIQTLEWAGLSDPKVFDKLEADVLKNYQNTDSAEVIKALGWALRGLSFSGNEKYLPTLEKVAVDGGHRNLRKHAKKSVEVLRKYKDWNPMINPHHNNIDAGYPSKTQRYSNMLKSGEYELMRIAGKRIAREQVFDKKVLSIAAQSVQEYYPKVSDTLSVDSVAWVMRALASSTDPSYKPLIEEVFTKTEDKKLRRHAKKYLAYFE